jgi:hypothetical protein
MAGLAQNIHPYYDDLAANLFRGYRSEAFAAASRDAIGALNQP